MENSQMRTKCEPGIPTRFYIGIQLRTERVFKTVDVRFVNKEWWFWHKDIPKTTATITHMHDQERGWAIQSGSHGKDNERGGIEASYSPVVDGLPRNAILWYQVTAVVEKEWNGWLSFQLRRGSSHKGYGRAKICFKFI
jgi:hypothetical protein